MFNKVYVLEGRKNRRIKIYKYIGESGSFIDYEEETGKIRGKWMITFYEDDKPVFSAPINDNDTILLFSRRFRKMMKEYLQGNNNDYIRIAEILGISINEAKEYTMLELPVKKSFHVIPGRGAVYVGEGHIYSVYYVDMKTLYDVIDRGDVYVEYYPGTNPKELSDLKEIVDTSYELFEVIKCYPGVKCESEEIDVYHVAKYYGLNAIRVYNWFRSRDTEKLDKYFREHGLVYPSITSLVTQEIEELYELAKIMRNNYVPGWDKLIIIMGLSLLLDKDFDDVAEWLN